jgi:hypothetical protein
MAGVSMVHASVLARCFAVGFQKFESPRSTKLFNKLGPESRQPELPVLPPYHQQGAGH